LRNQALFLLCDKVTNQVFYSSNLHHKILNYGNYRINQTTLAWYIAGPLVGLTVPALLILGNKILVLAPIYVTLCRLFTCKHSFFKYDWKKKFGICFYSWDSNRRCNCFSFFVQSNPIIINDDLRTELATYGIKH
jgi:hypothetical protein